MQGGILSDPTDTLDHLWKVSWLLRPERPAWSGFMQMNHSGNHPGQSSVIFLPMIDMSSSDMTCIYSTLMFVSSQARQYNVTPVIRSEQPLWWKETTKNGAGLGLVCAKCVGWLVRLPHG